jgi:hypothetical protein
MFIWAAAEVLNGNFALADEARADRECVEFSCYRARPPRCGNPGSDPRPRAIASVLALPRAFAQAINCICVLPSNTGSFMEPLDRAPAANSPERPVLTDTLKMVRRCELVVQACSEPVDNEGTWLSGDELCKPDADPLASLTQRFGSAGFKFNRRAAAAALMLRFGWGAGFSISSYLLQSRIPIVRDYAMCFSPRTLLRWLCIRDAMFVGRSDDVLAGNRDLTPSVSRADAKIGARCFIGSHRCLSDHSFDEGARRISDPLRRRACRFRVVCVPGLH